MPKTFGDNIWIHEDAIFGLNTTIGHASCIGYGKLEKAPTRIGNNVSIGAFCIINHDVNISDNVEIDHYCRIESNSSIGKNTKILYGAQVFEGVSIGNNCIIGGELIDRSVVEDNVTYMGHMAHTYRNPGTIQNWDNMIQPSPIIKSFSIIGEKSLIIGGVSIGPESYISAGEIVRTNVPPRTVLFKGQISSLDSWRGIVDVRKDEE